jgi:DHA1 family bicyclomycin/chloramphenicol resistance-like MFS transporter
VIATAAAWVLLPETRAAATDEARTPAVRSILILARSPAFWAYAMASSLATAVFFAFLGGTPFVAQNVLGLSGTEYGAYLGLSALGYLAGNFITARTSARTGIHPVIIAGGAVSLVAIGAMAIAFGMGQVNVATAFGPLILVGVANGLVLPNAIAGGVSVRPDLAGAAAGLSGSLQIGVGAVASMASGWAVGATHSPIALTMMMLVFAVPGFAACLWARGARN